MNTCTGLEGELKYLRRRVERGDIRAEDLARVIAWLDEHRRALIEIDTYLANDPDVWRIVSVAKAGDVLCDILGPGTILAINASVEANLCPKCLSGATEPAAGSDDA